MTIELSANFLEDPLGPLGLGPLGLVFIYNTGKWTTKGSYRRLEKSHKVWVMMMIAASFMWVGAAEKSEQSKTILKNQ